MLKNYNVFINNLNESIVNELEPTEIHRIIIVDGNRIRLDETIIDEDINEDDYKLDMSKWHKDRWDKLRDKDELTKIFYEKNGEKVQYICSYKDALNIATSLQLKLQKQEARGTKIEYYQKLGLILNMPDNFNYKNDLNLEYFKKLSPSNYDTNLLNNFNGTIGDDVTKNLTYDNYKLISGSFKFRNHIEYVRKTDFKIAKILHTSKTDFAKKLQQVEKNITEELGIQFHEDKVNTTDIFLLNNDNINKYIDLLDVDKCVVISEPVYKSSNPKLNKKGYYEGGICYIIPQDKLSVEDLVDKLKGKELDKNYDSILQSIIDEHKDKDYSLKFIQVTLKKSKTGAQFGKVTKTLNRILDTDINKPSNESFFSFIGNLFMKVKNFFKKLFTKHDEKVEEYSEDFAKDLERKINTIEDNIDDYVTESTYIPKPIETEIINDDLFVYYEDKGDVGFVEKNMENKISASKKLDILYDKIIYNAHNLLNNNKAKEFHEKFADVLSVGLMGATNLPMYMVFGSSRKYSNTFTLHHYRINKNIRQVSNAMKNIRNKPLYIVHVVDHTKNNKTYRNLHILIYNYSSSTKQYITVSPRTNSSKSSSVTAETSSTNKTILDKILDEYNVMKAKKL